MKPVLCKIRRFFRSLFQCYEISGTSEALTVSEILQHPADENFLNSIEHEQSLRTMVSTSLKIDEEKPLNDGTLGHRFGGTKSEHNLVAKCEKTDCKDNTDDVHMKTEQDSWILVQDRPYQSAISKTPPRLDLIESKRTITQSTSSSRGFESLRDEFHRNTITNNTAVEDECCQLETEMPVAKSISNTCSNSAEARDKGLTSTGSGSPNLLISSRTNSLGDNELERNSKSNNLYERTETKKVSTDCEPEVLGRKNSAQYRKAEMDGEVLTVKQEKAFARIGDIAEIEKNETIAKNGKMKSLINFWETYAVRSTFQNERNASLLKRSEVSVPMPLSRLKYSLPKVQLQSMGSVLSDAAVCNHLHLAQSSRGSETELKEISNDQNMKHSTVLGEGRTSMESVRNQSSSNLVSDSGVNETSLFSGEMSVLSSSVENTDSCAEPVNSSEVGSSTKSVFNNPNEISTYAILNEIAENEDSIYKEKGNTVCAQGTEEKDAKHNDSEYDLGNSAVVEESMKAIGGKTRRESESRIRVKHVELFDGELAKKNYNEAFVGNTVPIVVFEPARQVSRTQALPKRMMRTLERYWNERSLPSISDYDINGQLIRRRD